MDTVSVSLEKNSYPIYIGKNIFASLQEKLQAADKWLVITDENIDRLYCAELEQALAGVTSTTFVVPAGENSKSFHVVESILNALVVGRFTRQSAIIAFGGGVVGDLAGFCASIFMRGISYVQIPTTLLAQVDSSVGGKTGINLPTGKNLAGTFYQPQAVIIDTAFLSTLPSREFIAGLGEIIKYGVIYDYELLRFIEENFSNIVLPDLALVSNLIRSCCLIKAEIVGEDERESNVRKILNFGHTVGHALEALTGYSSYLHGEAVLIGMYWETLLALRLGLVSEEYSRQIIALIKQTRMNTDLANIAVEQLIEQMRADKKNSQAAISFIFPVEPGKVIERLLEPERLLTLFTDLYEAYSTTC